MSSRRPRFPSGIETGRPAGHPSLDVLFATFRPHWPEYLIEACCLALFMLSAAVFATLLQHPASPWVLQTMPAFLARLPMGAAMGLTAMAIIYSPLGRRSGAHMNPAVTLTFWRLGKIASSDAACYVLAQFAGAVAGITMAVVVLAGLPAHPSVGYVATVPGSAGAATAFAAELVISFGLMTTVLHMTNHRRLAPFTGVCAGMLVMTYITIEAPLSGMSMNPARSFGPALLAGSFDSLWIYFTAPLAGMLVAAEVFVRGFGLARVRCAKLHHDAGPCIFRCRTNPF
jgi:aquaporin Z